MVGNNQCRCSQEDLTDNMMCAGVRGGGKDACLVSRWGGGRGSGSGGFQLA